MYVTDVVQAIYRAIESDDVPGGTFNVNGDEIITWNDYFSRFNDALGRPPLPTLNTWPIAVKSRLMSPVRVAGRFALTRFNSTLMKLNAQSSLAAKYMKVTESSLKLTPTSDQLKLFALDVEYTDRQGPQAAGLRTSGRRFPRPGIRCRLASSTRSVVLTDREIIAVRRFTSGGLRLAILCFRPSSAR